MKNLSNKKLALLPISVPTLTEQQGSLDIICDFKTNVRAIEKAVAV